MIAERVVLVAEESLASFALVRFVRRLLWVASKDYVFCTQEIECSSQSRIALGVGQQSTDSLTLLVAEDFQRARSALDHCAANRHSDVSQVVLSKPPPKFPDLFRGA